MSLDQITSVDSGRKRRRRLGRGIGSGLGKTAGRGSKGEGSRTGGPNRNPLFEGGQFQFWQRMPKRGFSNARHTTRYQPVPLARLIERIADDDITVEKIVAAGLADTADRIKITAGQPLQRKLSLKVHRVTGSVREAVAAAGGTVEESDA